MKRIVMWALFLMIALGSAEAQNTPTKGNVSTEIQFNPFGMDGKIFKLDALRFRYFFTDNAALRLNWGMEVKTNNRLDPKDGIGLRFGVIVTLKEMYGVNRIDEFIRNCHLNGWLVNKIDIKNRIDIHQIVNEEIQFE